MEGQLLCGRYELTERLGDGDLGARWTAHDRQLDRTVAVTVLTEAELTPEDGERLEREVRAAIALPAHPHLVAVHDVGRDEGSILVVTEHIRGRSLEQVMAAGEPPSPERAVDWARQACAGLAAAHEGGLVHQDLRPARLLLAEDGTVRLLGLGTAWLRPAHGPAGAGRADTGLGSVPWMSPEQVRGEAAVDHRSDLYSVGCLLYQLLTGATPFGHREVTVQLGAHLRETPAPPSGHRAGLPAGLDALVLRLLAKAPEERPESAAETVALLAALTPQVAAAAAAPGFPAVPAPGFPAAAAAPVPPGPPAAPFTPFTTDTPFGDFEPEQWWRRPSGRRAVLAAAGSALALALISGLVWVASGHQGDGKQPVAAGATASGSDTGSGVPFGTDPAQPPTGSPGAAASAATGSAAPSDASSAPGATPPAAGSTGPTGTAGSTRPQNGSTPAPGTTATGAAPGGSTATPAPQAPPSPPTAAAAYGCSGGLIDSYPVKTGAGVVLGYFYLYFDNATGTNCAATIKTANSGYGTASHVSASISRCGNTSPAASCTVAAGTTKTDDGNFTMYAGPVKVAAAGACVTGSGSITWGGVTATTAGSLGNRAVHCG
ncbi:serine/threonine-protein kinase [Kitasatospora sp. NPDC049258]|uniref:serine/threonine-protein kinase n=1 Tax=Kitasatospora sp. NPDC049258 TaxID=3155394 RepID=UPI003416A0F7